MMKESVVFHVNSFEVYICPKRISNIKNSNNILHDANFEVATHFRRSLFYQISDVSVGLIYDFDR